MKANARATRQAVAGAADTARALEFAERNANAATEQVIIASETAKQQLRAYISVTKSTASGMAAGQTPAAEITFKNTGQTPAVMYATQVQCGFNPIEFDAEDTVSEADGPSSRTVVGAGSEMAIIVATEGTLSVPVYDLVDTQRLYAWGTLRYTDIFGAEHQTSFKLSVRDASGKLTFCSAGNSAT